MVEEHLTTSKGSRSLHLPAIENSFTTAPSSYDSEFNSENAVGDAESEFTTDDLSSDLCAVNPSPQGMSVLNIHVLNAFLIIIIMAMHV